MNKNLILILFLFSLTFISAQPPFQQSELELGLLLLETAMPSSHKMNEDYYIHTHVYNGTNGLLITSGIDCNYHFYNHQIKGGEHIDIGILTQYGSGYYNYTDGSLLNETGQYSVLLWCNSTSEGGFIQYSFDVTPSGQGGTENTIFFLFIIVLIYGITFFGFFGKNIPITILGGMALMFLGVYLITHGIIIFRDDLTNYIAYLTIAVGAITAIWAILEQLDVI